MSIESGLDKSLNIPLSEEEYLEKETDILGSGYCVLCNETLHPLEGAVLRPEVGTIHQWHKSKPGDLDL